MLDITEMKMLKWLMGMKRIETLKKRNEANKGKGRWGKHK